MKHDGERMYLPSECGIENGIKMWETFCRPRVEWQQRKSSSARRVGVKQNLQTEITFTHSSAL